VNLSRESWTWSANVIDGSSIAAVRDVVMEVSLADTKL
jgi:hypothetical protein